jgi:F420-0:gamma-glutamyl ligase-like protein
MTPELWRGLGFSGLGVLCFALELLVASSTVVIGGIGVVLCLMGRTRFAETSIEPTPSGCAGQVTIRLELAHLRLFRKHRCVVTLRESADNSAQAERETWYAKHHR